jgi:hypothetical protein
MNKERTVLRLIPWVDGQGGDSGNNSDRELAEQLLHFFSWDFERANLEDGLNLPCLNPGVDGLAGDMTDCRDFRRPEPDTMVRDDVHSEAFRLET